MRNGFFRYARKIFWSGNTIIVMAKAPEALTQLSQTVFLEMKKFAQLRTSSEFR